MNPKPVKKFVAGLRARGVNKPFWQKDLHCFLCTIPSPAGRVREGVGIVCQAMPDKISITFLLCARSNVP